VQAEEALGASPELRLRWVVFGGEALQLPSLAPWFARHGDAHPRLVNMYGITETTVHVTYRPLGEDDLRGAAASVIGRAIPDLDLFVLGPDRQPVPIGVPGELHVGGAGLAQGYLGRPALTAERFVPHPFAQTPGERLYRSGDLARYLPDGDLEYLGRIDHQVKIRGFRIELGEVEAALAAHPAVQECVVLAWEDGGEAGDRRLVAYLVPRQGVPPSGAELRSFLGDRLPDYMVPASFVPLTVLPLTANGKLDRRALPAPDGSRTELGTAYAAPRTPREVALARVWSEALGVDRVGLHDNFFALGGDSIRAIRVHSRARREGLAFSLQDLFRHQTLHALSGALRAGAPDVPEPRPVEPFALISAQDREALPAGVEDAYPLALLQLGMLFHSSYRRESATYHDVFSFELRAPFRPGELERVVRGLTERHPALRTSFELTRFSEPLQLVHRAVAAPFRVADLRALPAAARTGALADYLAAERVRGFDWDTAPLLRFQVHRLSDATFQLSLSFHHAILDGWSVATLLTELFRDFLGAGGGEAAGPMRAPATSYRDFVAMERAELAAEPARRFWTAKLDDAVAARVPRWGANGEGEERGRGKGLRSLGVALSAGEQEGLERLASLAGIPLKSVCLAAHVAAVYRLTGQPRVLTGLVSNGRPETEDGERVLGLFLNTVPFALRVEDASWRELALAAFAAEGEMLPFRRFPMAEIQRRMGVPVLFETLFNFTHFHVYNRLSGLAGIEVLSIDSFEETSFPLAANFSVDPGSSRLTVEIKLDAGEFPAAQALAIAGCYGRVLAAMAADPGGSCRGASLLSRAERHQLLVEWNDSGVEWGGEECLHDLLASQAALTPDSVALTGDGESWTFAALDRRAEGVAIHLRRLGVGPEVRVGVCLPRSPEMVAVLLGVLKAGGAYVPLDPAHPRHRLAFLLADSRTAVLVTAAASAGALPDPLPEGVPVLRMEDLRDDAPAGSATVRSEAGPDHLAYVLYTSGSTGRPKGVMIPHRGLTNYLRWSRSAYLAEGEAGGAPLHSSIGFDLTVTSLWCPLLAGREVVLVPEGEGIEGLAGALRDRGGFGLVKLTPAHLESLSHALTDGEAAGRATAAFVIGGEALQGASLELWRARAPRTRLFNEYGPTETVVGCSIYEVPAGEPARGVVPIGRPVANARIYVLGGDLLPVLPGVAGELCVGGEGVGRGYLGRPDLTAERFVPSPFAAAPGERLYRTGDLVQHRPDGVLEFLGRIDHQVKVRGYRIELGEIEAMLAEHPKVRESAVVAREESAGDKRLVAYVVPADREAIETPELLAFLRARLPEYMIPSFVVPLAELPLTPNGKVDRRALPAPEGSRLAAGAPARPRTALEGELVEVWRELLGVADLGVQDDFFALGGHSLLATQLVSRLRGMFRTELPVRSVFENPTVAALAVRVQEALRAPQEIGLPPLVKVSREHPLPLSFSQERLWLLEQIAPGTSTYNLPNALRLLGDLRVQALAGALNELARRHDSLRTTFALAGGPVQRIAPPAALPVPVVDLGGLPEPSREAEAVLQTAQEVLRPFDLARGPLVRARVLRLGPEDHVLILTMHHIVSDGWSMEVLVREMVALYGAARNGLPSPLPEPALQYVDFAAWQRGWMTGETLDRQISYWRSKLAHLTPLELPMEHPRPAAQSFRAARVPILLPAELSARLRHLSRRRGVSLFMMLLAGFKALLARWSGQVSFAVGSPIAGRNRLETEGMIGFFLNTLVLRTDLAGDPGFGELLERVRETCVEAYSGQDLPFEKLIETLEPERDPGRTPLFQVLFNMLNFEQTQGGDVELPGLATRSLPMPELGSKFDLTLYASGAGERIELHLVYGADLFGPGQMARWSEHYQALLEAAAGAPETRLSDLPLIRDAERRQLAALPNPKAPAGARAATADPETSIPARFRRQVELHAHRPAVKTERHAWTYRELDREVARVAACVQRAPAEAGSPVAVLVDPDAPMVAALMGVLAAGRCYVPLDPAYPEPRLSFMLEDSGAGLLFTDEANRELGRRLAGERCALVALDTLDAETPPDPARAEVAPADLAYILYTSGSLGTPKGVLQCHRNVLHHVQAYANSLGIEPEDRVSLFASYSFDAAVMDIYGALLNGAALHLYDVKRLGTAALARWLVEEGITIFHSTPTLYRAFLDGLAGGERLPVRRVVLGGEEARRRDAERFLERFPEDAVFVNGLGPTESTLALQFFFDRAGELPRGPLPVGYPVPGTEVLLLTATGEQVAPYGVGEIVLRGPALALGYWRRPEATAAAFLPDPDGGEGRVYRTGDLGRRRPDGSLEFIGRRDFQVKIRGHRIELGEIESILGRHAGVREAVVLAREDAPGDRRLVAYVVPAQAAAAPADDELRGWLRDRLPDPMVPAAFVTVERLPLTPSGKVDRRALPAPGIPRPADQGFAPPRTALEELLVELWSQMLRAGRVGVHDDFFSLGGHSLAAIQLLASVRQALGVEVPLYRLFAAPTVAGLARTIAALRGEAETAERPPLPALVPDPARLHEPFPLTDLQQAYWLGRTGAFELGNVSAHIYREIEFVGLDVERLGRAWQRVIDRHPALRTVILPDGRQQVLPGVPPYRIEVMDLRSLPTAGAELDGVRRRLADHGPRLDTWPLFELRASLLDEGRVRLHFSLSLVVCDAYSARLVVRELIGLYGDPEAPLPPVAVTPRDYVLALQDLQESETYQRSLGYWRSRLASLPPSPDLPLAKNPASVASRFVRRRGSLDPAEWRRFKSRASQAGLTSTAALATLFAEVLAAWSKSSSFTLNLLLFNRLPVHPQVTELVGNFSSTLLLEVSNPPAEPFSVRARRLQEQLWRDIDHGMVTGVRVLRELARVQGGQARPVAPVVFSSTLNLAASDDAVADTGQAAPRDGGGDSSSRLVFSHLQTPQVWLDHQVSEEGGTLYFNWDAVEEMFPPGLLREMFDAYRALLGQLAEDDEAWQAPRRVLVSAEQLDLRARGNTGSVPVPAGLLQDPFLARAAAQPDHPAVISAFRTLSYGEVDRLSNRLARRLRELGARPGRLVAVVMEKGWEQVVAVIAVLKSGAAYLPLDPGLPTERLTSLMRHAEVELTLTQPWLDRELEWPAGILRVRVDAPAEIAGDDGPLAAVQSPDDLAYVIFTSGSTGQPKGVMIEHRAALNTIVDMNRRFRVTPEDRVLALSALTFDLSVYDVFGLLAAGGTVVMPEGGEAREPARWLEWLVAWRVTIWDSVPALMRMLADHLEGRSEPLPESLRLVLMSGDWIPVSLPGSLRSLSRGVEVMSLGGATEASIWSICYPIRKVNPAWVSIPYGKAMDNQAFHVLDEALEPRPLWVPGELYIGGVGLARGYWRDAERTAASFITHPRTGERLYRTGDWGRYLPDGNIEFLGREDLQVKVQGYRIELGEIEAALAQHPEVSTGVVAALGEQRGSKRLVGYYVPAQLPGPAPESVREFLLRKLPEYMVPNVMVPLEALPLSANGKVDRRALPAPQALGGARAFVAPRDEWERGLVTIWEEVLETRPVGAGDNFFDLGGHSLLAVRLMARIQQRFGQDLPLSILFQGATLEHLAGVLRQRTGTAPRSALVEIQAAGRQPPLFCVHPVGGNVLCYAELSRRLGSDQPLYGLQALDPGDGAPPRLEEMAARYLAEVRRVRPEGPYLLAGWSMGGVVAFEMAQQLRREGQKVALVTLIDTSALAAPAPVLDPATLACLFASDLAGQMGIALALEPAELRPLPAGERLERVLDHARHAGALPPEVDAGSMARWLALFESNYLAMLAYVPEPYPGRIALVDASAGEGSAGFWAALAAQGADTLTLEGDHFNLLTAPRIERLADFLRDRIAAVAAERDQEVTT